MALASLEPNSGAKIPPRNGLPIVPSVSLEPGVDHPLPGSIRRRPSSWGVGPARTRWGRTRATNGARSQAKSKAECARRTGASARRPKRCGGPPTVRQGGVGMGTPSSCSSIVPSGCCSATHGGEKAERRDEDARDAAQEVWIKAWAGIKGSRGDSAFSTRLYRIVVTGQPHPSGAEPAGRNSATRGRHRNRLTRRCLAQKGLRSMTERE